MYYDTTTPDLISAYDRPGGTHLASVSDFGRSAAARARAVRQVTTDAHAVLARGRMSPHAAACDAQRSTGAYLNR